MMFLPLNLQFFASDDVNWDEFDQQFEQEFETEQPTEEETQTQTQEDEIQTQTQETQTQTQEDETQTQTQEQQTKGKPGPDEAFKRMRQELEQSKKFERVIREIAEKNGVTPEQLLQAYEQRRLEEQAKAHNTSPEILQRLQQLEQQNMQLTQQQMAERFNRQVNETIEKYNLTNEDVQATLAAAKEQGFTLQDFQRIPFETIYKTVNIDKLIQRQIEEARQKELEKEREIERTSTVPVSPSEAPKGGEIDIEAMVLQDLRESGDID